MPLATISSYGSISTFSDYLSDIDPEIGVHDFAYPDNHTTVRRLEHCRRATFTTVLLITFVVILFGFTATEKLPLVASKLCDQFLLYMTPSSAIEDAN